MTAPNEMTACDAAARIAAGELSAEALVRACLERIAAREPQVQAWQHLDPEHALAQAREADAALATGRGVGPLHGVPVGIKDVIDTVDMPTEHGSPMFRGRRSNRDAACVGSLRDAGAIIMGKTVTTELANTHPGKTRNPHDPRHTPGGSSSGSAAAVADCHVPLALGTQTGGSVIRPASFCGIYGLKPTLGLISRSGVLLQSHTLDTVGVYGRSVEDLGLVTDSLSARDPTDPVSFARSRGSLLATLREEPPTTPCFAFLRTPAWDHAPPAARTALEDLATGLGDRCHEEELPPPFERIIELHRVVMGCEDLHYYGGFLARTPELLSEALRTRLESARDIPATAYLEALEARETIYAALEALLTRVDAVICPASAGAAPAGLETTGSPIFNGLWTYLGVPCVTLPRLTVDGLPMGVQLVGRRGDEGRLLRTARWLDARLRA
jgi:Asp-tRNA(Asn)/Glu-tRNA(Gln) amidotransferase A subunit family amidase